MLYAFVKKDGEVKRVGGESPVSVELQGVFMPWSEAGWELAAAEEWDAQVINHSPAPVEAPAEVSEVAQEAAPEETSKLPGESSVTE